MLVTRNGTAVANNLRVRVRSFRFSLLLVQLFFRFVFFFVSTNYTKTVLHTTPSSNGAASTSYVVPAICLTSDVALVALVSLIYGGRVAYYLFAVCCILMISWRGRLTEILEPSIKHAIRTN